MSRLAALCGLVLGLATPVTHHTPKPEPSDAAIWERVAVCESGNNPTDTAGSFYGLYQFAASTWTSFDTNHYAVTADRATPAQQLTVARRVLRRQGPRAWPVCSLVAGLTLADGTR